MSKTPPARLGVVSMVLIALASSAGCASKFPPVYSAMDVAAAEVEMAPKELLAAAKRVVAEPPLSLGVQSEGKGFFLTTYQPFPGEWHIGRRWQERTQYRVTVIPDFDEPAKRSRIEVIEQTEQRASDKHEWKRAAEVDRPERAKDMLSRIVEGLKR